MVEWKRYQEDAAKLFQELGGRVVAALPSLSGIAVAIIASVVNLRS
jgi:hypothetical protein